MSRTRLAVVGLALAVGFGSAACPHPVAAQAPVPQPPSSADQTPTLVIKSQLVFLDVTVLDKHGKPVVTGLTKDDFTITQDKRPQSIFSFEPPEVHQRGNGAGDNPSGKAPTTIFVLDQLNSTFQQMAYIRYCVHEYLASQPARLSAPAEVMLLGNESLEMVQGYTRDKAELLSAVDHLPAAIPYKLDNGSFFADRFVQSINALQEIALQNRDTPGRKNVIWVGHGGPSLFLDSAVLGDKTVDLVNQFTHQTLNMLVDSRLSLFVIYPGLRVNTRATYAMSEQSAQADINDDDPFAGDFNFGVLVNATGGKLYFDRNDVDAEIRSSENLGSHYYTLTYQPPMGSNDGHFARIRVLLRNPELHAITKAGYFEPDSKVAANPQLTANQELMSAALSVLPYHGLTTTADAVGRDSQTQSGRFNLDIRNLGWQPAQTAGSSLASVDVLAVSLSQGRNILASKAQTLQFTVATQDSAQLAKVQNVFPVDLRVPRRARIIRFVVRDRTTGRIGSFEVPANILSGLSETPSKPAPAPVANSPHAPNP